MKGTLAESRLAWSLRLTIFKFCPWLSLFAIVWGEGKKVTAILLVTVHTVSKDYIGPSFCFHRQQNGIEQPTPVHIAHSLTPAHIARDCSLKQTKSKYETREAFDVKTAPLYDRIKQFPGQHLSVIGNTSIFRTVVGESRSFLKEKHVVIPFSHALVSILSDTNIVHF